MVLSYLVQRAAQSIARSGSSLINCVERRMTFSRPLTASRWALSAGSVAQMQQQGWLTHLPLGGRSLSSEMTFQRPLATATATPGWFMTKPSMALLSIMGMGLFSEPKLTRMTPVFGSVAS